MAITINTKELMTVLDATPSAHNIMLVGKHGIGKSEILTKYFSDKGMKVVALFLGQMSDPGDLIGLPNKNEETGNTDFMPPYWFPVDGKPIVLFLDELNRARPEILQTIMDLALNRKLAGRPLPEGSRIISAVNDGEEYQLTDLDPALVSRFNIYTFRPTVQEWMLWAAENKLDERVVNFIQENNEMLDGDTNGDMGLEKTPDRRGWKRVSDIILGQPQLEEIYRRIISGVIGAKAATLFFESIKETHLPTAKDLMTNFDKYKSTVERLKLHELSQINESLFRYMETGMKTKAAKDATAANLPKYIDLLSETGKSEAFAHWVSLFSSGSYVKAVPFIIMTMDELYGKIQDFINKI